MKKIKSCRKGKHLLRGVGDYNMLNTPEMSQRGCFDDHFVFSPPAEAGSQLSKHFEGVRSQSQSQLSTLASPGLQAMVCSWGLCFSSDATLFSPKVSSVPLPKIPLGSKNLKSMNPVAIPGHLI